jgi:hypothetical protein
LYLVLEEDMRHNDGMTAPPLDAPYFLNAEEVAARWRMSLSGVYRMISTGRLPVINLPGKTVRIALSVIEDIERTPRSFAPSTPAAVVDPDLPPF